MYVVCVVVKCSNVEAGYCPILEPRLAVSMTLRAEESSAAHVRVPKRRMGCEVSRKIEDQRQGP